MKYKEPTQEEIEIMRIMSKERGSMEKIESLEMYNRFTDEEIRMIKSLPEETRENVYSCLIAMDECYNEPADGFDYFLPSVLLRRAITANFFGMPLLIEGELFFERKEELLSLEEVFERIECKDRSLTLDMDDVIAQNLLTSMLCSISLDYGVWPKFMSLMKEHPVLSVNNVVKEAKITFFYDIFVKTKGKEENEQGELRKQKTYLMKDKSTGCTKIGKSFEPRMRERTLQSEKPSIELLAVCNENIEKKLHKEFADFRVRGEWFRLEESLIKGIIKKYGFKMIIKK